jgi:hypothetical protein
LFVGQTGFLAYVIQSAGDRGLPVAEVVWAFAGIKVAAGLILLVLLRFAREAGQTRFLGLGMLLGACIVTVSLTRETFLFFVAMLLFEVAFNTLSARLQATVSARLQARVVSVCPGCAGWLTGAILLGAAAGPPLNGMAIGAHAGAVFIALAVASALVPETWDLLLNRKKER